MLGTTWSDKSACLVNSLIARTNLLIEKLGVNFEVKHTMSGFNDRLIIAKKDNRDGALFISFIIGWFYADAEIALVHKTNSGKDIEYLTAKYIEFDNEAYKSNVKKDRYEGYLCKNQIKYYPAPFDEREEDIFADIKTIVTKLADEQSVETVVTAN